MIKTNPEYWDCECEDNYIHRKTDTLTCPICDSNEEDCPDSTQAEIDAKVK